jgi:hypothetical protein
VDRLTTAGLKALVTSSRQRAEGPIVLAAPAPEVRQVIKLGGYGDYFAIYPSVEAALKAVQARRELELPGQTIKGRYQIIEKLGQGHLGTVLKVIDLHLKRSTPKPIWSKPASWPSNTINPQVKYR